MTSASDAFSLKDRHIVIVGASSGIGKATALACAEMGAKVSICARREDKLQEVAEEMGADHGFAPLDVKDVDAINPVFDRFVEERGPIHGLVYSAGYVKIVPVNVITAEAGDDMMAVNLRGAVLCVKAAVSARRMAPAGLSAVLISSTAAQKPAGGGMAIYSASKGGMESYATAAAIDLGRRGVRINALAAGLIDGELIEGVVSTGDFCEEFIERVPLGRLGHLNEIAHTCVYLLSPAAGFVTGSVLTSGGGFVGT